MSLTFETLRVANAKRGAQWDGKPASLDDLSFRGLEFVGEAGEAANFCKKLARHLTGRVGGLTLEEARDKIMEELADTVICADRIAELLGEDLGDAVVAKFNMTSRKHGFAEIAAQAVEKLVAENAHLRERFEWWMKNAEDIAKERGDLFRAGEAMRQALFEAKRGVDACDKWDEAAQPMRDMIAAMTPSTKA